MNRSPFFFGRWGVPQDSLVHAAGNRYHLVSADGHDGPVIIFTRGIIPGHGEPVLIHINADTCLRRGYGNHRHRTKIILRVKPVAESDLRPGQGTLTIVDIDPCIDRAYRIAGEWWLKDDAGEPTYKYNPPFTEDEDLGLVLPMEAPTPPQWREEDGEAN